MNSFVSAISSFLNECVSEILDVNGDEFNEAAISKTEVSRRAGRLYRLFAGRDCRHGSSRHSLPALQVATAGVGYVGLLGRRSPRILLRWVRDVLEYVRDAGNLPDLSSPVDVDVVSELLDVVKARGLV